MTETQSIQSLKKEGTSQPMAAGRRMGAAG